MSNLDAKLREEMRFELRELTRSLGITTLHVTHDQVEAMALADRIAVMFDGAIVQIGRPEELYRRPATRDVAAFLGQMNWLPGTADGSGGAMTALGRLVPVVPTDTAAGRPVLVGVRPEAVEVVLLGGADWHAAVRTVMFQGHGYLITLEVAGVRLVSTTVTALSEGASVGVRLATYGILVFAA